MDKRWCGPVLAREMVVSIDIGICMDGPGS